MGTMTLDVDGFGSIECEFEIEEAGSRGNGWDDPGSGTIVALDEAVEDDGTLLLLTDEARWKIEERIGARIDEDPDDFYGVDFEG
jgi:hypothetical protein